MEYCVEVKAQFCVHFTADSDQSALESAREWVEQEYGSLIHDSEFTIKGAE